MSNQPELSIIIPAYNEAAVITKSLQELGQFLVDNNIQDSTEVIVVTADSPDGTAELAEKQKSLFKNFLIVKPGPKVGKGRDVREGFKVASGKYQLFTDADLATPLHHIPKAVTKLKNDDVVIGVRDLNVMHETALRKWSSKISNYLIRMIAVRGITDTQCGFKAFRANHAKLLFSKQQITGWGFDIELLTIARKHKLSLATVDIHDWSDPKDDEGLAGESHAIAMLNTLRELLSIRLNIIRGLYK